MYPSIKIKEYNEPHSLSQIYSQGLEYSLINKDNIAITPYFYCKDFMGECVHGMKYQKKGSIYGFSYDFTKKKEEIKGLRILLRNDLQDDVLFETSIVNSIKLVNAYFKLVGKFGEVEIKNSFQSLKKVDKKLTLVLNLPFEFLVAPPLLSLLLLLLRCGNNYKEDSDPLEYIQGIAEGKITGVGSNDSFYIKQSLELIKEMTRVKLYSSKNFSQNWPEEASTSWMHNSTGIVSYSKFWLKNKQSFKHYVDTNFKSKTKVKPIIEVEKELVCAQ